MIMRKKVSTLLDPVLFRRVKVEAARQNKQISEIVAEALEIYLRKEGTHLGKVEESWHTLPIEARQLKKLMEEEVDYLEA
ncbi:MAG TPA: hypothetical protein PLP42_02540 [Acidobacteriota bacterium]|nr:hypothetical protein [Acidobacteriota bacterium]